MSSVQIEQKSYEMPPREGISIAHCSRALESERNGDRLINLVDEVRVEAADRLDKPRSVYDTRICSQSATEVASSPEGAPFTMSRCVGDNGSRRVDVIGATIVVRRYSFVMSF
jgi:hypothetical protein